MADRKVRAALGTGLGDPVTLEISGEEVDQLQGLTVEEALHSLIRRCNGQPTARLLRTILLHNRHFEVQVNGKDADPANDKVKDYLQDPGKDPVEELNLKVTERQSGG